MFLQAARSNAVHVLKDILIRFLLNLVLINNQLIAGAKLERQGPPGGVGRQVVLLQSRFVPTVQICRPPFAYARGNGETFPRHDDRCTKSRHEGARNRFPAMNALPRRICIESRICLLSTVIEIPGIISFIRVDDGSWPLSKLTAVLVSQRCLDRSQT